MLYTVGFDEKNKSNKLKPLGRNFTEFNTGIFDKTDNRINMRLLYQTQISNSETNEIQQAILQPKRSFVS